MCSSVTAEGNNDPLAFLITPDILQNCWVAWGCMGCVCCMWCWGTPYDLELDSYYYGW